MSQTITINMTSDKSWCRGFQDAYDGHGPFGSWFLLEENPTPENAELLANWLKGWAKGRKLYLETHHETH